MQNYFPVTWPLAWRWERKGGSEGREGKRRKGDLSRQDDKVNNKVSAKVRCGPWGQGGCRASTGFILGGRTTSASWSAGADPLRWPAGHHFVSSPESSGVSLRPLHVRDASTSALHDATSNLCWPPAQQTTLIQTCLSVGFRETCADTHWAKPIKRMRLIGRSQ